MKSTVQFTKKEFIHTLVSLGGMNIRIYTEVALIDGLEYGFVKISYGKKLKSGSIQHKGTVVVRDMYLRNKTKFWRKDYNKVDNSDKLEEELIKYRDWFDEYLRMKRGEENE